MRLFISKPFKGTWYYEMQVGPFVLQFLHDLEHEPYRQSTERAEKVFMLGRFQIWRDQMWRDHMLLLPRWLRLTFVGDLVCDWKRRNRSH